MARHLRDQHGQGAQNKHFNYDVKNQNSEVLTPKNATTTTNCPNCNINIDPNCLPKHIRYCTLQDIRSSTELAEKSTKLNENNEGGKFKFESPPAVGLSMPGVGEEMKVQLRTKLLPDKSTVSKCLKKKVQFRKFSCPKG